ncbi:hypothetical protein DOY81_014971, partial [Sarcophaga bullata]
MDSSMMLAALHGDSAVYAHVAKAEDLEDYDIDPSTIAPLTETILAALTNTTASTTTTTIAPDHDSTISMNNFYPALVQCFGIIIC